MSPNSPKDVGVLPLEERPAHRLQRTEFLFRHVFLEPVRMSPHEQLLPAIPGFHCGISVITPRRAISGCFMGVLGTDKDHCHREHIETGPLSRHVQTLTAPCADHPAKEGRAHSERLHAAPGPPFAAHCALCFISALGTGDLSVTCSPRHQAHAPGVGDPHTTCQLTEGKRL